MTNKEWHILHKRICVFQYQKYIMAYQRDGHWKNYKKVFSRFTAVIYHTRFCLFVCLFLSELFMHVSMWLLNISKQLLK